MVKTKETKRKEMKEQKVTPELSSEEYMEESSGRESNEERSKVSDREGRGKENSLERSRESDEEGSIGSHNVEMRVEEYIPGDTESSDFPDVDQPGSSRGRVHKYNVHLPRSTSPEALHPTFVQYFRQNGMTPVLV